MENTTIDAGAPKGRNARIVGLLFGVLMLLSVFPLFTRLDRLPIRLYDESRLAVNSYEMARDGDYLVPHFNGNPDMWNTKPPLMVWSQVLCIRLLGNGELAVRLPSALSGLLTVCVIFWFLAIRLRAPLWGFFAGIILICSHGYVNIHATRTGDYDAMVTLFTTCYLVTSYLYIQSGLLQKKFLVLTALGIFLAFMTKGVAGLLFVPAIILYACAVCGVRAVISPKAHWFATAAVLAACLEYYGFRETRNPGFMDAIFENELGGRYLQVNEGHAEPWYFYLRNFREFQFSYFYGLLFVSLLLTGFTKNKTAASVIRYAFVTALWFLLVITTAKTKLEWYDVPLYPFMALIAGGFFYMAYYRLRNADFRNAGIVAGGVPLIFGIYCYQPYSWNFNKNFYPSEYEWTWSTYQMSHFMRDVLKGKEDASGYGYYYEGYDAHLLYYRNLLKDAGKEIPYVDIHSLAKGDRVFVTAPEAVHFIESNYSYSKDRVYNHIVVFYTIR